ncbi:MAG: hypothetical protein LBT53_00725 [Puniceicoccales bacterium]|jgi:hypothetical protein|nr:hypothetical protein [Puniceicoccales bacterium]
MDNSPASDGSQPQQQVISLQNISQNFLGAIQRQFDLLAFNLAAIQQATAEQYEAFARQTKLMPVAQIHQNFEQTQAYARSLLFRQTVNDLASMASACMDNCHLLGQLVKNQALAKTSQEEANNAVAEAHRAFVQSPLNEKFELLERDFGIMCGTEDAIIAIAIGLRVLALRNGTITEEDVNEDGELVFEFKTVQVINPPSNATEQKPEVRIADTRRTFRVGDRLELANSELLGLSITVTAFFHDLFRAVDEYGVRTVGVAGDGGAAGAAGAGAAGQV